MKTTAHPVAFQWPTSSTPYNNDSNFCGQRAARRMKTTALFVANERVFLAKFSARFCHRATIFPLCEELLADFAQASQAQIFAQNHAVY